MIDLQDAEVRAKLKLVEEALIWANKEINDWMDTAYGCDPEDHEVIMEALKIIRSL